MNAISAWSVALLCLLTTSGSTEAVSCILSKVPLKQRMCKCVMDGAPYAGQEIDLTPLSGRKFTFTSKSAAKTYTYSWSMCTANDQTPTDSCNTANDAAICQNDGGHWRSTGRQVGAHFLFKDQQIKIHFIYGEEDIIAGKNRTTFVHLICDKSRRGEPLITASNAAGTVDYNVEFTHARACPRPTTSSGIILGLGMGSVIDIIFFSVLISYFLGGVVYLRAVRGAEGSDMVPNYSFWSSLPGLIKDGAAFLFSGCKKESGYETI